MKTHHTIASLIISLMVAASPVAFAESGPVNWSVAGSGCTLDTGSTSIANVDAPNVLTTFAGSSTGTIHITCPITALQAANNGSVNPGYLELLFVDDDGTTDNCTFKAYLYRYNYSTSQGVAELVNYNGQTDGSLVSSSPWVNSEQVSFTHSWDYLYYFYILYIDLFRNTSSCNVKFLAAQLQRS